MAFGIKMAVDFFSISVISANAMTSYNIFILETTHEISKNTRNAYICYPAKDIGVEA
jgi:hypothetical protein